MSNPELPFGRGETNDIDEWRDQVLEGDNLELLAQLPDDSIGLTVTSPPYYNAKLEYAKEPGVPEWKTYDAYLAQMEQTLKELHRVTRPGRRVVWNADDLCKSKEFQNCTASSDAMQLAKQVGFLIKTKIIWYDPMNAVGWFPGSYPNGANVVINWCTEDLWVFQKKEQEPVSHHPLPVVPEHLRRYDLMDKDFVIRYARNQVWNIRSVSAVLTKHPAPFPEELVAPCIRMWSKPGDIVLDPFAGRGTVGLAAQTWRRHFILMERMPAYVKLAYRNNEMRRVQLANEQLYLPYLAPPVEEPEMWESVLQASMELSGL